MSNETGVQLAVAWKQSPDKETSQPERFAARLRSSLTGAEKALWRQLRGDIGLAETHFRRQVAIGPYIADFCCFGARLVVELDGPVHDRVAARVHDNKRDDYLRSQGFRILRFRNEDVTIRRDEVLNAIRRAVSVSTPTPGPSPQGGGERVERPR